MDDPAKRKPSRILITGGGTAGHVYPGLALAEGIRERQEGAEFLFVGAKRGAEERVVPAAGHALETLPVRGLPSRGGPIPWLETGFRLAASVWQALGILRRFRPQVVIGTGGYASAPVLLAVLLARALGLWRGVVALHEANIIPGRFNRWISGRVDFTGTSFPETLRLLADRTAFWTGHPLREGLEKAAREIEATRRAERQRLGIPSTARVVLVFGGSSGARTINRAMAAAALSLLEAHEDLHIVHGTGRPRDGYDPGAEIEEILEAAGPRGQGIEDRYRRIPYLDPMERYYAAADLVVGRAGAGSVWEIAAFGIPAVLIPKSGLPGDHQVKNARFLERVGLAQVLYERRDPSRAKADAGEYVDPEELARLIVTLLYDPEVLESMRRQARGLSGIPSGKDRFHELIRRAAEGRPLGAAGTDGMDPGTLPEAGEEVVWLSPERLLAWVQQRRGSPNGISEGDRRYVEYKTDRLFGSPRWQERNIAVKLAGLIEYRQRLPRLIEAVTDRTPVPWHRRLLGGDFEEVGFIRRNALQAIWRMRVYDPEVRRAILTALEDPYFEVRSWAARAVIRLADLVDGDEEIEERLRRNLGDRWFEVVVSTATALGRIARDPGILDDLLPLLEHGNWKVQQATLRALMHLIERDVIPYPPLVSERIRRIPMKGLDFSPRFPLKHTWEDFQELLSRKTRPGGSTLEKQVH